MPVMVREIAAALTLGAFIAMVGLWTGALSGAL